MRTQHLKTTNMSSIRKVSVKDATLFGLQGVICVLGRESKCYNYTMANASRDENNRPTLLGALSTDGVTPTKVKGDPSTHRMKVDNNTTGTDHGVQNAVRDENFVPVLMAVSNQTITVGGISYIQDVTPVEIYADGNGNLLVNSM